MATGRVLVVGGGGSGGSQAGSNNANGGDAGTYNSDDAFVLTAQAYSITVGTGGAGAGAGSSGNTGSQSTGFGFTSAGGAGGISLGTGIDGTGSATSNDINGTSTTYSIGGGHETALKSNTTKGSGSDGRNSIATSAGIDGVVIVSYLTADANSSTSGGTKTTNGSYTVHTFTSSGTFTFVPAYSLALANASFSLTGFDTILNYGRIVSLATGYFSLTGQALSFTLDLYTRVTNRVKNSVTVSNRIKATASSVVNRVKNSVTVTNKPKS